MKAAVNRAGRQLILFLGVLGILSAIFVVRSPTVSSQSGLEVGYAILKPTALAPSLVTALFRLTNPSGVLVTEAAVPGVHPTRAASVFVQKQGVQRTAVALVNPELDPVTLEVTLLNADGTVRSTEQLQLDGLDHRAVFTDELFDLGTDFLGSLRLRVDGETHPGVAVVTLRQGLNHFGEPILTTLPVATLEDANRPVKQFILPQVGVGIAGVLELTTQIVLINPREQFLTGAIEIFGSDGQPLELAASNRVGSRFAYAIPPDGIEFLEFRSSSGAVAQRGYAIVSSDDSPLPIGSAVFQFRTPEGEVVSEAGVASSSEMTSARLFIDSIDTRTGIAVANPGRETVEIVLDLLEQNGLPADSTTLEILPGGQTAAFADELFELPVGFSGTLVVRSSGEVALVSLKLTVNSRGDPILTTLPLVQEGLGPEADPWILPQLGFGHSSVGEFSSRIILLTQAEAGGTLTFYKAGGGPMNLPHGPALDFLMPAGSSREVRPGSSVGAAQVIAGSADGLGEEFVVNVGQSLHPRLLVVDEDGQIRSDLPVTARSIDESVASVDSYGRIVGREAGFSTLVVTSGSVIASFPVTVSEVVSSAPGFTPGGLAQDLSGQLYLADWNGHTILFTPGIDSAPNLYAGTQSTPGLLDGSRLQSRFNTPSFLALDRARGSLYVSDSLNHAIRRISPGTVGGVTTLAGSGGPGSRDGPVETAEFNQPQGIALDDRGFLWLADSSNHTVRRVDLDTGVVVTVAGSPGQPGFADGIADSALFSSPSGLAVEAEPLALQLARERRGDPPRPVSVVIADTGNHAIRRVWEDGRVETLETLDSNPSRSEWTARQQSEPDAADPYAIALDPRGNIYASNPVTGDVIVLLAGGGISRAAQPGTFQNPVALGFSPDSSLLVIGDRAQELRYGPPIIESHEPEVFPDSGGTELILRGRNFAPETLLTVAGVVIEQAQVLDSLTIRAVLPDLPSGRTTMTVLTRGGLAQAEVAVFPRALADLDSGEITTVAGGSTYAGDGGKALSARMVFPGGLELTPGGELIVADPGNHRIRSIDPFTGLIRTIAGTGRLGGGGDGGPAIAADLAIPRSVTLDSAGNAYVADSANCRIRRIDRSDGTIETVAGTGQPGFGGDGGPATEARFNQPDDLAFDRDGNLFVADTFNHRIRRIDASTGIVTTIAGTGQAGFSGDGGAAVLTELNLPFGVGFDGFGQLLIADTGNHRIRRVDLESGLITTFAGTGVAGFTGDGGPASEASLYSPSRVRSDPAGNIVIADTLNQRIRIVDPVTSRITTVAGNGLDGNGGDGGPALAASFSQPQGIAADGAGNIYVSDHFNQVVRRVDPTTQLITRLAGGGSDYPGDNRPAWQAALNFPRGVDVDRNGDLLISDTGNSRIRRVDIKTGVIATLAGNGSFGYSGDGGPAELAALDRPDDVVADPGGNIWISDSFNHRIRRIDEAGTITTQAGTGQPGYWGDSGPAIQAAFYFPQGLAADPGGNIYVADTGNHRIRKVETATGLVTTVAGNGFRGFSGDAGPATEARLNRPSGVAVDTAGGLLIADTGNDRIRRVDLISGVIQTLAGTSEFGFSGDGGPAVEARLNLPHSIAIDGNGNIYFTDHFNQRVRRIDAGTGFISTVAGDGAATFSGDGGHATEASFLYPAGLAVDEHRNIFIADSLSDRLRAVRGGAQP